MGKPIKFILLSILVSLPFTTLAGESNSSHSDNLVEELRAMVFPVAKKVVEDLLIMYCPYELEKKDIEYIESRSTENKVTYKFLKWSPFKYCNDGIPESCLVSVSIPNKIDSFDYKIETHCSAHN